MRLALFGDEPHRAALGVDRFDAVADPGARAPFLGLSERDDVAGLVAGGETGLDAGQPARLVTLL